MFELRTSIENGIMELSMVGSLDMNCVDDFEAGISASDFSTVHQVEIDFKGVEFIDSTGIGSIVNLIRSLDERGLDYKVLNVGEEIQEIFMIIGLEDLLTK